MKMSNDLFPIYLTSSNNSVRYYLGTKGKSPLIFCGLNPSTATSEKSDQTITKVKTFAQNYGYDSFIMINLYPKRSTEPSELPAKYDDKLLTENIKNISSLLSNYHKPHMLVCWGDKIVIRDYLNICAKEIGILLGPKFSKVYQFGSLTIMGHPRHPSRITYNIELNEFDFKNYILKELNY
jgi:hypothetical protein